MSVIVNICMIIASIVFYCIFFLKTDDIKLEYDFIIVGVGTAGSVLASRLSEISSFSILAIEQEPQYKDIPNVEDSSFGGSKTDFNYETEPQERLSFGFNRQGQQRSDYDSWAEIVGDSSWKFENIKKYFTNAKKYERAETNRNAVNLSTDFAAQFFANIVKESGYNYNILNDDNNAGSKEGFAFTTRMVDEVKQEKTTVSNKYLDTAIKRPNLKILTDAKVILVRFDRTKKRAVNVRVAWEDNSLEIYVRKEIIISAGAIGSAKILLYSGIGPEKEMLKHHINVIKALPVGQTLMDQLAYSSTFLLNASWNSHKQNDTPANQILLSGRLASDNDKVSAQNIELLLSIGLNSELYLGQLNEIKNTMLAACKPIDNVIDLATVLLHPKSVGSLQLYSLDAFKPPIINPNYLSDPTDIATMIKGVKIITKIIQASQTLQQYNPTPCGHVIKACSKFERESHEHLECTIRHKSFSVNNPVGTCPMGSNTTSSVVDKTLRIHGIDNLRVVDASVFPSQISGPTQAAVVMLAEKTAVYIKQLYDER